MRKEHIAARIFTLVIGLWIMALGVALSIAADLGTSPISGVPYAISLFTPLSVGTLTIMMHIAFILIQIILLRKEYNPLQLLQLPVAFIFGFMTDAAVFILQDIQPTNYIESLLLCILGIVLVAIGVSSEVASDTVPLAGEGLAIAISKVLKMKFGTAKVLVDCSLVIIAITLSLIFLNSLGAIREGTVMAALLVGTIARQLNKLILPVKQKYLQYATTYNINK